LLVGGPGILILIVAGMGARRIAESPREILFDYRVSAG